MRGGVIGSRSSGEPVRVRSRLHRRLKRVAALQLLRWAAGGRIPWSEALPGAWTLRGFRLRTAWDAKVFDAVVILDEYEVRGTGLSPADVVVDIGAHVGCFGALCWILGSRHIESFEAHRETFETLERNYQRLPGARAHHAAVVGDGRARELRHSGYPVDGNTGQGSVLFGGRQLDDHDNLLRPPAANAEHSPVRRLDDILLGHERVRLLKLDCEGSEFPILFGSRHLDRVEAIVGEYHEVPPGLMPDVDPSLRVEGLAAFDVPALAERLAAVGFEDTQIIPVGSTRGLFRARRPSRDAA